MVMARACRGRTERGDSCRAAPVHDSHFCVFHDPDHAETVQQARSAGGQRRKREVALAVAYDFRGLRSIDDLTRFLEVAAYDALSLDNTIARVRAMAQLVQVAVGLLEKGEMEERLASIEAALGPRVVKSELGRRR
jgi:hypothetical protein